VHCFLSFEANSHSLILVQQLENGSEPLGRGLEGDVGQARAHQCNELFDDAGFLHGKAAGDFHLLEQHREELEQICSSARLPRVGLDDQVFLGICHILDLLEEGLDALRRLLQDRVQHVLAELLAVALGNDHEQVARFHRCRAVDRIEQLEANFGRSHREVVNLILGQWFRSLEIDLKTFLSNFTSMQHTKLLN
jgi:hypothetical protein